MWPSHENGSIESPHGHFKLRLHQALLLRNSCDFDFIESYQQFIEQVSAVFLERFVSLKFFELRIQRGCIIVADMHFEIAIYLRVRTKDMSRQTRIGTHVAQQKNSRVAVRHGVLYFRGQYTYWMREMAHGDEISILSPESG